MEIAFEEQKNKFTDDLNMKIKELKKNKDVEGEVSRKLEQLQKKYD